MNSRRLIADMELVHVAQTGNSGSMEKEGLRRILVRLKDYGFDIALLATDRSPQGKAMMAKPPWNTIRREFDVWHFVKSVVKKLHKKSNKKDFTNLRAWIPSKAMHLWWSAGTCCGDKTLLQEKWHSVLHHIGNRHSWTGEG